MSYTKKELFDLYNAVNREIYGYGTRDAKILYVDNLIIFNEHHPRLQCLKAVEEYFPGHKYAIDNLIHQTFREMFARLLKEKLGMKVVAVMRDYNSEASLCLTIVVTE